jgi:hypothetical protein
MTHFGIDRTARRRHGVCHRCGWSGPATKVQAATRIFQRSLRGYGRLCVECRVGLLHQHLPLLPSHRTRRAVEPETKRHRHVA